MVWAPPHHSMPYRSLAWPSKRGLQHPRRSLVHFPSLVSDRAGGMLMKNFKIDAMSGSKVISSTSVEAQSHVHAVVKTVPRPLKPGRSPGKPWIRVTDLETRKANEFQFLD